MLQSGFVVMFLACAIILAIGVAAAAFHFWKHVEATPEATLWLRNWAIRGLIAPALLWMIFNSGLLPNLPSFVTFLDRAHGYEWWRIYELVCGVGVVLIASYWGALTVFCMLLVIWHEVTDRRSFLATAGVWTLLESPILCLIIYKLGWFGAGLTGIVWLFPVFYSCSGMVEVVKTKPQYSRAIANMQFGKFEDAEAAVIEELEHDENDFEGWMMLAELYALHFNDLSTADRTVHEMCDTPGTSVSQISVALHRLADWYLKVAKDPVAARRALEEICQRLPGTHLDRMARLRIGQLPLSRTELLKQQAVKSISLPKLNDHVDEAPTPNSLPANREAAQAKANQLVESLKANPNDLESRVSLARILAERLDRVDLALEQLELLLALPGLAPRLAAEWLNLMAGWQIRLRHDEAAAELLLERITRLKPQSTEAFTAQRRLNLMRRAAKSRPR